MEPAREIAPPVVVVMVVHAPGHWFDETLASIARQDYSNLRLLFLITGEAGRAGEVSDRIKRVAPTAFVRAVAGNPGFGPVANEVLQLVEGENGFFCFLHDDVALEPDAIRLLIEELYRSNAGVVGPKVVEWDAPSQLQHVGFGVDRFGEIDPIVEPGELDQEQHDGVRDVFALPSACLIVRADLFRALGGFDPQISFHGEDLDLCWRAHRSGARVVVVPSARVRHREQLLDRRPDLAHELLRAQHRLRIVTTLTAARRLPLLSLQLTLFTLAELVVGLFTGSVRRGVAGVRALIGLLPRSIPLVRRRRAMAPSRHVPDSEVIGLQLRGSARITAFMRSRDAQPSAFGTEQRTWRERAGASGAIAWICVLAAIAIGSRLFIADGVPSFGQFLDYPVDASTLMRRAMSGWWPHGGGATTSSPTGAAIIAIAAVGTFFNMGLLHTLGVVGLLVLGPLGIWRATAGFTTNRSRIVTLVVYAAVPLPAQLISIGRWSALACYAATPWVVDGLRRLAGISAAANPDEPEVVLSLSVRAQAQILALTSVVIAITVCFAPGFVLVAPVLVAVLAVATLLGGTSWKAAVRILLGGLVATLVGILLSLPWFGSLIGTGGWATLVGPTPAGDRGNSLRTLASFDLGNVSGAVLSLALYLPVIAAPLLGRGWRLAWSVRAGLMVLVFGWLVVLDDHGGLPFRLPEPGIVLAPVAVGVAIAAGCVVAAFELDVRGGNFGWRQPLGLLSSVAIAIGLLPGPLALSSGRWDAPETTMVDLLGLLPQHPAEGDYRVLWVGDDRVLPVAGQTYRPGVGYALTDDRSLQVDQTWSTRPGPIDADIVAALDAIASGATARAGRLLAPFSIRYIIVPVMDGAISTNDAPLPVPAGLTDALGDQLDIGQLYGPPNFLLYENRAWIPMRSVLTAEGAEASNAAGASALAQADVSGATPIMVGADQLTAGTAPVPVGTIHVAVPFDRNWVLDVDGMRIEGRPAFGATMAFEVTTPGTATLRYEQPASRTIQLLLQMFGWAIVLLVASGLRRPRRRVRTAIRSTTTGPVLSLDDRGRLLDPGLDPGPDPGPDPGLDPGPDPGLDGGWDATAATDEDNDVDVDVDVDVDAGLDPEGDVGAAPAPDVDHDVDPSATLVVDDVRLPNLEWGDLDIVSKSGGRSVEELIAENREEPEPPASAEGGT